MENDPQVLVSTDWLFSRLSDPETRILDATWYLPNIDRDAKAEYDECHIPNARYFDIDDISDHRSDLPHMVCLLYTSPSPRDISGSRMPSSA